ncbi:MAG TPA: hypothetical protein V6D35_03785 [Candidatus Sericytochromatia bacterium]
MTRNSQDKCHTFTSDTESVAFPATIKVLALILAIALKFSRTDEPTQA